MFHSCSKSMSAYCLSKPNEKAYSIVSRIPTVQPKRNWGKKKKGSWRNWIFLLCRVFREIKNHICLTYI